jgi:FtsH-binding integral membrane protein
MDWIIAAFFLVIYFGIAMGISDVITKLSHNAFWGFCVGSTWGIWLLLILALFIKDDKK